MNRDLIFRVREKPDLYNYLKYNSYLYKPILRKEITLKQLEDLVKKELKQTTADKLNNISNKIELANSFLNILK